MFGLVLNALRARRAQTVALFALTVLAGLGASAAPWFGGWARGEVVGANDGGGPGAGRGEVVGANSAGAPAEERVVAAQGAVRFSPGGADPLQALRDRVREH